MKFTYDYFDYSREGHPEAALVKLQKDYENLLSGQVSGSDAVCYFQIAFLASHNVRCWHLGPVSNRQDYVTYVLQPTFLLTGMLSYSYLNFEEVRKFDQLCSLLKKALCFCETKVFSSKENFAFADTVFHECNVADLIITYPEFNPALPPDSEELKHIAETAGQVYFWAEKLLNRRNCEEDFPDFPKGEKEEELHGQ